MMDMVEAVGTPLPPGVGGATQRNTPTFFTLPGCWALNRTRLPENECLDSTLPADRAQHTSQFNALPPINLVARCSSVALLHGDDATHSTPRICDISNSPRDQVQVTVKDRLTGSLTCI